MPDELPDLRTLRVKIIKLELIAIGIMHREKKGMETRRRWGFRRVCDEMHQDEAVEVL